MKIAPIYEESFSLGCEKLENAAGILQVKHHSWQQYKRIAKAGCAFMRLKLMAGFTHEALKQWTSDCLAYTAYVVSDYLVPRTLNNREKDGAHKLSRTSRRNADILGIR